MRWAFQIGQFAGTKVRIHLTFGLLLIWVAFLYGRHDGLRAAAEAVLFVCLVFLCVLLHEFGHALAARRFGIRTPEITLLPIGGVARLERMPEKPLQEIAVAVAGPAVNIAIATLLWGFVEATGGFPDIASFEHGTALDLPVKLLVVNLWLVLFNLVPAFPMDGGRILRALLALWTDHARATRIAATLGQAIAVGFAVLGLFSNPMLILIAVFVYCAAASESAAADFKQFSAGLEVRSAMVTQFEKLPADASLQQAAETLLHTTQREFPVTDHEGHIQGLLTRETLIAGLRRSGPRALVSQAMHLVDSPIHPDMLFERALSILQEARCPALPVVDSTNRLVGLFTPENADELVVLHSMLSRSNGHTHPPTHPNGPAPWEEK